MVTQNEQLPDAVLAPLFYLEGCYRVTCRQLTQVGHVMVTWEVT